jgi:hypothetical protein
VEDEISGEALDVDGLSVPALETSVDGVTHFRHALLQRASRHRGPQALPELGVKLPIGAHQCALTSKQRHELVPDGLRAQQLAPLFGQEPQSLGPSQHDETPPYEPRGKHGAQISVAADEHAVRIAQELGQVAQQGRPGEARWWRCVEVTRANLGFLSWRRYDIRL